MISQGARSKAIFKTENAIKKNKSRYFFRIKYSLNHIGRGIVLNWDLRAHWGIIFNTFCEADKKKIIITVKISP